MRGEVIGLLSVVAMGIEILELLRDYFSNQMDMKFFFNSDILYLPDLFRNLSEGSFSFSHWHFSAATFIFPDWVFYGIAYFFSHDAYYAFPIFFCLQIIVFWLLTWALNDFLIRDRWSSLFGASFFSVIVLFSPIRMCIRSRLFW